MEESLLKKLILIGILIANLFGIYIGFYSYLDQILKHPLFFIFIPDCPLYVLLISIYLIFNIKNETIKGVIKMGLIKYSLWTLFVLLYFHNYFLTNIFGIFLFFAHIGMFLENFLIKEKENLIILIWFLINDIVDYGLNMHPYLPKIDLNIIAISFLLTFISYYLLSFFRRNNFYFSFK